MMRMTTTVLAAATMGRYRGDKTRHSMLNTLKWKIYYSMKNCDFRIYVERMSKTKTKNTNELSIK